jgi:hypothetical protein
VQEFGPEWAKEHLVPQVLGMVKNPHYLYRMTVLVAISSLANFVSQEVFTGTMLPVLIQCAKDRVPNVKFNVAKVSLTDQAWTANFCCEQRLPCQPVMGAALSLRHQQACG